MSALIVLEKSLVLSCEVVNLIFCNLIDLHFVKQGYHAAV